MKRINNNLMPLCVSFCLRCAAPLLFSSLASCGELADSAADDIVHVAKTMQLDYHDAYLMVGDTLQLSALFQPDSVTLGSIFWYADDPSFLTLGEYGTVEARRPGSAYVHAISESSRLQDSCLVHVIPRLMFPDLGAYPYDMVLYALDDLGGQPLQPHCLVAAVVGNEVRGYGEMIEYGTPTRRCLYMRIYSPTAAAESIDLCLYDPRHYQLYLAAHPLVFDGNTHGSPSDPLDLHFSRH